MPTDPTPSDLHERTRAARAAWEAALAAVPPERMTEPHAPGAWSTRDVIAHLTADHRWMAAQLMALVRGALPTAAACYGHNRVPPSGIDLSDQDQRNAWRHEADRLRSLEEVLANAPVWADALEEAIAALPADVLAAPHTFGDHLHIAHIRSPIDAEPSWPLAALVASYADQHYATHTADLRVWIDQIGG